MRSIPSALCVLAFASLSSAQTSDPFIFVANNGNLEGSVSSMRVNSDGSLSLVDRIVTGSRTSTSLPCGGCNAYAISISPSGTHLATAHAAGQFPEDFIVYEVASDGMLSIAASITVPQGGLDLDWVRDDLLSVAITDLGGANELRLYDFDAVAGTLTLADAEPGGTFLTSVAVHPTGQWIVTNDSFANTIRLWRVTGSSLALIDAIALPISGVAVEWTPDGRFLFAAGGISFGGQAFSGFSFESEGEVLTEMPSSPFMSPGDSPKGFAFTPGGLFMFVSHGRDATIRVFSLDPVTGEATDTGESFDVGSQGTLQGMDTLDGRLFALDNSTAIDGLAGAYAFDVDPGTGALGPVGGAPVLTGGISPNDVASWAGTVCPGDVADDLGFAGADGQVSFGDFLFALTLLGPCPGGAPGCDFDLADDFGFEGGDGQVSFGDFLFALTVLGPCS